MARISQSRHFAFCPIYIVWLDQPRPTQIAKAITPGPAPH